MVVPSSFSRATAVSVSAALLLACVNSGGNNSLSVHAFVLPSLHTSNNHNSPLGRRRQQEECECTDTSLHSIQYLNRGQTAAATASSFDNTGNYRRYNSGGGAGMFPTSTATLSRGGSGSGGSPYGWHRNAQSRGSRSRSSSTRLAFGSREVFPIAADTDHVQVCLEKCEDDGDNAAYNNNVVDQRLMDRSVQAVMEQWQQKRRQDGEQVTQTVRVRVQDGTAYPFVGTISTPLLQQDDNYNNNNYNNHNQEEKDSVVLVVHNADATSNTPQLQPGATGGALTRNNNNRSSRSTNNLEATVVPLAGPSSPMMSSSLLPTTSNGNNNNNRLRNNNNQNVQTKTVRSNSEQSFAIRTTNNAQANQASPQIQVLLENTGNQPAQAQQPMEARIEVWHGVGSNKKKMGMDFKQLLPGNNNNNNNNGDDNDAQEDCRISLDVASLHRQFGTVMDVMPPDVLAQLYGGKSNNKGNTMQQQQQYNPPRSVDQYLEIRVINTGNQPLQASVVSSSLAVNNNNNDRFVDTNPSLIQEQQRILGNAGYRKQYNNGYSGNSNGGYTNGGFSSQVSSSGRPILQPNPFLEGDNPTGTSRSNNNKNVMGSDINGQSMSSDGYSHRMNYSGQQKRVVPYSSGSTNYHSGGFRPAANDFAQRNNGREPMQKRGGFLDSSSNNSNNSGGLFGGMGGSNTRSSYNNASRDYNNRNSRGGGNNAWSLRSGKIAAAGESQYQTGMMTPTQSINSNRTPYNNNANGNSYSRLSNIQSQQQRQRTSIVPRGQRDGAPRIPVNPFLASDRPYSTTGRGADGWLKRQMTGKPRSTASYRTNYIDEQRTKVEPVIAKLFRNDSKVRYGQSSRNSLLAPNPHLPQDRRQSVNPYTGRTRTANNLPRPSQAFGRGRVNGNTQSKNLVRYNDRANALPRPSQAFGRGRVNGNTSRQSNAFPKPSSVFGQSNNYSFVQDRRSNTLPRPSVATGRTNIGSRQLQNALPRPSAAFGWSNTNNNYKSNAGNAGGFIQDRRSNTLPRPSVATGRTNIGARQLQNALPRPSEAFGRPRINENQVMADQGLLDEKASRLEFGMVTDEERMQAQGGGYGGYDNRRSNGVNSKWDLNYWMDNDENNRMRNGSRGGSNNRYNSSNRNGSSQSIVGSSRNGMRETSTQLASGLQDSSMEDFRSMGGTRSYVSMQDELQQGSNMNFLNDQYNRNGQRQSSYRRYDDSRNNNGGGFMSAAKSLFNGLRQ